MRTGEAAGRDAGERAPRAANVTNVPRRKAALGELGRMHLRLLCGCAIPGKY